MSNMPSLAGQFLVARATLKDKYFGQSVVLLLEHGPEGAFGLVLNQRAEAEELPFPLFMGGPCSFKGLIMLHGHEEWNEATERQVMPGVFLGDAACLEKAAEAEVKDDLRFRVFTGYSGWGPKQLEHELTEGSWVVRQGSSQYVFDTPVDELWVRLAPPTLPEPSMN